MIQLSSEPQVYDFPRFGSLAVAPEDEIAFPWGLPGFSNLKRWAVLTLAPTDRFLWLQSLEDLSVALPICDPWAVFEDYEPKLPAYAKAALELESSDDFVIMGIVVVTKDAGEMTMNLLAPLVMNLRKHIGRQITLEGTDYSVRTPIPRVTGGTESLEEAAVS